MPPPRLPQHTPILLPVTGHAATMREVTAHVAALALASGATVAILAVMDTGGDLAFTPEAGAHYTRLRIMAQTAIEEASAILRGAGVTLVEHLIMDGVPHRGILEVADELGAGLIVLGATAPPDGAPLDPLAAAVVREARCPVLLVPPGRGTTRGTRHE